MAAKALSRKIKVLTLVPVLALSGAWTASMFQTASPSAYAADSTNTPLPDGTNVPSKAIEAPASVPVPGAVAPAVPSGKSESVVASASSNDVPAPALLAYQRAATIINRADKSCNVPWELIGAIGRVESDHGRYDNNTLSDKGVSTPGIYGPRLDGGRGTSAITDTDGGRLDRDKKFDRAVGPMQFIPATWEVVKVDANGDGTRNPQDINDASLASAVYLCSGKENLAQRPGQESAVFRYNQSKSYVNLVLRIMAAYQKGDYSASAASTGNSGSSSSTYAAPSYSQMIGERRVAAQQREQKRRKAAQANRPATPSKPSTSRPAPPSPAAPAAPAGTDPVTGGVKKVTDGLTKTVDGVGKTVKTTTDGVTKTVTGTLTYAEAKTRCLTQGISALNLVALGDCIFKLRN